MKCDFCGVDFKDWWEKGVTYNGIDEHHNPPKFMFKKNGKWNGKLYNFCREHHKKLHKIIIKILNKKFNGFKFIDSEYYIWIRLSKQQQQQVTKEVYDFTEKWLKDGNTKTIKN